jgi:hypothetical protein
MNFRNALFAFLFILLAFKSQSQEFKAAASLRVITPEKLLPISGGMGAPTFPVGKQGDLFVRVLVLEKGDTRVAIVGIDNLGWPAALGDRSRALIPGIPAENILIGATHTHSAPDAYAFPDQNGTTSADLDYLNWCVKQVADAVNDAISKLEPAVLKTAVGEAKGKIAYNYYAPDLYDPRCGVIQAIATSGVNKGKTIATLVNYASHPEILGTKRRLMSPDFVGPLYDRIEERAGGIALFMNGAQGGMVTADNRLPGGGEVNDWQECVRIGNLLADEALRIIADADEEGNPELLSFSRKVEFPVDSEIMRYVLKNSPLIGQTDGFPDASRISTRINLLTLGKARILTIPGEALPNIGYYLKRKMETDRAFLFGLTNDAFGYILTKEDFASFKRYEYISKTSLGEHTGEILVNEALKLLEDGRGQK